MTRLRGILIAIYFLVSLSLLPNSLVANDDKKAGWHDKRHELRKQHHDYDDHNKGKVKKGDEGNEITGQTAVWLIVSANLTVALSTIMKGVNRFVPLAPQTKSSIKRFNQLQKKHLMRFHYVLNPLALCIAFLHFLLSSCRSSSLPEWGLLLVTLMVILGLSLKFNACPKWIRSVVYRLHTAAATFSTMILVLVVGHLIVDQ